MGADEEILSLTAAAVRDAGLHRMHLRVGDVSLFQSLISLLPIPVRWRGAIVAAFRRPGRLPALLHTLSAPRHNTTNELDTLLAALDENNVDENTTRVIDHLQSAGIEITGSRSVTDIVTRLMAMNADRREKPLSKACLNAIEAYLALNLPATEAAEVVVAIGNAANVDMRQDVAAFEARLGVLSAAGFQPEDAIFSANLGARFEYYTGFVFEISAFSGDIPAPVASGGRYDGLLQAFGAATAVPAVGAAIYTERLLAAVQRGHP